MPVIPDVLNSLDRIKEIHRKKNDDYASNDNLFSNFDFTQLLLKYFPNPIDQPYVALISTKLARLSNLLSSNRPPNNESIDDTFIDGATYFLIWKAKRKLVAEIGVPEEAPSYSSSPSFINPYPILGKCPDCGKEYRHESEYPALSEMMGVLVFCSLKCRNRYTTLYNQILASISGENKKSVEPYKVPNAY